MEYIQVYFQLGFSQKEILQCLALNHKVIISMRHLRRLLHKKGLYRRKQYSDMLNIAVFIQEQLNHSGQLYGYRWMHKRCLEQGYTVSRDTVYMIQQLLDPEGVALRRRKKLIRRIYKSSGPNQTWHIDGYDKLKPYGIAIHGCIDGFSRQVIWLEAYCTNNDPRVVLGYYMNTLIELEGCPRTIRADRGTENVLVESMQKYLRRNDEDSFSKEKSFIYVCSTANQRIEAWWSFLRKNCIQFYMNIFQALKDGGIFTGEVLHKEIMRFCFMKMIQDDLDKVKLSWNTHKMRQNDKVQHAGTRPMLLYTLPEINGAQDRIVNIDFDELHQWEAECVFKSEYPCDSTIFELCCILMEENNWPVPLDAYEAGQLFTKLKNKVSTDLQI